MVEKGWFDEQRGIAINEIGRVSPASTVEGLAGLYTSGWLKRGPSGIIGTNITDAKFTVGTIMEDVQDQTLKLNTQNLAETLTGRGVRFVDWEGYKRIEQAESNDERKRNPAQPWEKIVSLTEMLELAQR